MSQGLSYKDLNLADKCDAASKEVGAISKSGEERLVEEKSKEEKAE